MVPLYEALHSPEGTTHVMVNCMEDNIAAGQFVNNMTDAVDQLVGDLSQGAADLANDAMMMVARVVALIFFASIASCIFCCIYVCPGQSGTRRVDHAIATAIPYQEVEMGKFT